MIVIPMAGLSSRFFKAGYELPKYMLDLHGRSVFAHALGSFSAYFESETFLIICRDLYGTADFVRSQSETLGLGGDRLDAKGRGCGLGHPNERAGIRRRVRVEDKRRTLDGGGDPPERFQPFSSHREFEIKKSGDVAARSRHVGDEAAA